MIAEAVSLVSWEYSPYTKTVSFFINVLFPVFPRALPSAFWLCTVTTPRAWVSASAGRGKENEGKQAPFTDTTQKLAHITLLMSHLSRPTSHGCNYLHMRLGNVVFSWAAMS